MAKYLSPEAKKQRARRRKMRRLAMFSCLAAFVLLVSYAIVSVIEFISPVEQEPEILIDTPISGELTPNTSLENETEWQGFVGPVEKTINDFDVIAPDHRMFQLPENGSVDLGYFSDAVFVGDSLTDGLRIYHGIENAVSNIAKFVCNKSLTPKSFTEGVITFDWGRPAQNGVEAIVAENPKKVYITLGTNSMIGMTDEQFFYYYEKLLDQLEEQLDEDTVYYICSLTPTTQARAARQGVFHFDHMQAVNNQIANMANRRGMHYINLYEVLAGEDGYIIPEYCTADDGVHITPSAYEKWIQYLMTHTVHDKSNPYIPGSPLYEG